MAEQFSPLSDISIEDARQQLEFWEYLAEWSHNNIGPNKDQTTSYLETQLAGFLVSDSDDLAKSEWEREVPAGVEYQQDGAKTTVIIADKLFKEFKAWFDSRTRPNTNTIAESLNIYKILGEATNAVLGYFSGEYHHSGENGHTIERDQVVENAPGLPPTPENWPLHKKLDEYSDSYDPDDDHRYRKHPRIPAEDARFPFLVVLDTHLQDDSYEFANVYALDQGLGTAYFDNVPTSIWDELLELHLEKPYLIFCNGILQGSGWYQAFAQDIQKFGRENGDKPYLIILADGVADDAEFPPGFYSIVLPTPFDEERANSDYVPKRPDLKKMACTFGTKIVHLWASPSNTQERERLDAQLKRCDYAYIGYTSSKLISSIEEEPFAMHEFDLGCQGWRTERVRLVKANKEESLGRVGAMMRWRIEAEEGLAAGAGAALYRAADWLKEYIANVPPAPSFDPDDYFSPPARSFDFDDYFEYIAETGSPDPTQWLQAALREPLRQILNNSDINPDSERGRGIVAKINNAESPRLTFWINTDETQNNIPEDDQSVNIELGDAAELGVVTPLLQLRRNIEQAVPLAWQLALLHLTNKFRIGKQKSNKKSKPQNLQVKKHKLYLSEKYKIPAAGLYYYTKARKRGEYNEYMIGIGKNGQLFLKKVGTFPIQINAKESLNHNPDIYIFPGDLLQIPSNGLLHSGSSPGYISLLSHRYKSPPHKHPPPTIWTNALRSCPNNQGSYVLPPQLYRLLPRISMQRRKEGYLDELGCHYLQSPNYHPQLPTNALLFCVAGATVSCGLIERLQYTINAKPDQERLSKYKNPDWLFQLNRVLSEGFFEGINQCPPPGQYCIPKHSKKTWQNVWMRAEESHENEKLKEYLDALSPGERKAMYVMAEAFVHIIHKIPFIDKLHGNYLKRLKLLLLWCVLQFLTPGSTSDEELAFWNIHYPHWYKDLAYALKKFGYGPEPLTKDKNDWDTIATIIMASMPITRDVKDIRRNRGLSINDWVMAGVWRWFGKRAKKLPDLTLLMVQYIFDDVRK